MTTVYKLTTLTRVTRGDTLWGEGVTHTLPMRKKYVLDSSDVLHAYVSPEMAVLLNPIHGAFLADALLWECDGDVVIDLQPILVPSLITTSPSHSHNNASAKKAACIGFNNTAISGET